MAAGADTDAEALVEDEEEATVRTDIPTPAPGSIPPVKRPALPSGSEPRIAAASSARFAVDVADEATEIVAPMPLVMPQPSRTRSRQTLSPNALPTAPRSRAGIWIGAGIVVAGVAAAMFVVRFRATPVANVVEPPTVMKVEPAPVPPPPAPPAPPAAEPTIAPAITPTIEPAKTVEPKPVAAPAKAVEPVKKKRPKRWKKKPKSAPDAALPI
jgi:hypothetical protein